MESGPRTQPPTGAAVKTSLDQLAIFGGAPCFAEKLHVGRPNVGDPQRLIERIQGVLERRWLSNDGPLVQELEARIAAMVGVRHCVAMCNGTIALEIAARAAGLAGEVILPSFTFIATAHALQWQEITPVFCDIDPATHNLDPERVEALITPRTTGIIGVHLWGRPCAVEALAAIAKRHRLRLIFDAAHAFACSHGGRPVGSFGDAEVFSFHATKFFNSGEGGAVVTNNDALAREVRLMKNFGFADYDAVVHVGTNGKMTELAAAVGLTSLESIDDFIAVNRRNHERYRQQLRGLRGISLLDYDTVEGSNYQYVVLEVEEAAAAVGRDRLLQILHAENVLARRYFYPGCHRMEPYRSAFPEASLRLPATERVAARVLSLPTGTSIGEADIDAICAVVRLVVEQRAAGSPL